jgi:hypothetical protein
MINAIRFPTNSRGRKNAARQAEYDAESGAFAKYLLESLSRLDFTPGSRGWCYLLEQSGVISKGQFDAAERLINDLRKSGLLPIDFCSSDEKRAAQNLEQLDDEDPEEFAASWAENAAGCWQDYDPVSFWEFQTCYVEMAVEKSDLRTLFEKVCAEFHLPIWNAGGWSDINSRSELMLRFKRHHAAGRHCVLLYCGDFDPAGLFISHNIRKNLRDVEGAVGWSPDESRLTIDRFGLNHDFIVANRLTWIDGLETGSGKKLDDTGHNDHLKPYVQEYLEQYGARKVEANALVTSHVAGRRLCREAILNYVEHEGIRQYEERLAEERKRVRAAIPDALQSALDGEQQ